MAVSHANCTHPRTPAGRRACRAGTDTPAPREVQSFRARLGRVERAYAESAGLVPRRIQPRRSGARVAARNSSCVQAALHVDAHGGRCACGWVAA